MPTWLHAPYTYWCVTLICSELFLLIVRNPEITIIVKKKSQRLPAEQRRVERGLVRSLVSEIVLFVPVSVALVLLSVAPFLVGSFPALIAPPRGPVAFYSLLGLISYGFPFATLRRLVTRVALNTLKEFSEIASKDGGPEHVEP